MSSAPRDVIHALDFAEPRVVRIISCGCGFACVKLNWYRLDLPIETVIAPANVQVREARALFQSKDADIAVAVRGDRAVVNALHARHMVASDDRIGSVAPYDIAAASRPLLPWARHRRNLRMRRTVCH